MVAGALAGAAAPLAALAARGLLSYALVFAAIGLTMAAYNTGLVKLYMELAQGEARARAIVAAEGLTAPFVLLSTLGGGLAAARLGYAPVFLASAALTIAGAAVLALPAGGALPPVSAPAAT